MLLDTGSADTITLSRGCTTCQLNNHTAFDGSKSSTYMPLRKAFTVAYGDGTRMSGTLAKDKVQLAPAVVAEQQLLGSVTQKEKGSGAGLWSGILGLGPDQLSYIEDNVTPPSNLIKAGKLAEPLFGVALIPAKQGPRIGGGEYKWGAITQNYIKGDLVYANVTSSFYWGVDMQEIYYGSDKKLMAAADARRCIIDTGTTLIYTSDAAAQALHASIPGASRNQQDGAYYVPCNINDFVGNVLDVFIEIGGRKWGITSEDLAFRPSGRNDGLCVSGIQGGANQFTVLGDVFIKNHC
jgi:hypothetical protein